MYIRFGRRTAMQHSERGPRMHSCEHEFQPNFTNFVRCAATEMKRLPPRSPARVRSFDKHYRICCEIIIIIFIVVPYLLNPT
jgi:hypothetical protein